MAEYNGVHINYRTVRGVKYAGLWWYVGEGSKRDTKALGPAKGWTKAKLNQARLKQERELALQPGRVGAGEAPTVEAWVEQWKENRSDLSEASVKLIDQTLKRLGQFKYHGMHPFAPDRRIDKITRAEAAAFRADLAGQGISEATVCKIIRCASSLFGTRTGAASLDLIPFNPFGRLKKNTTQPVKGYPELSEEDEDRLIESALSPAWRAWMALTLLAGTRRAEPTAMLWSRVQWGQGKIEIPNLKTSRDNLTWRTCKMEPRLERVLLDCHEQAETGEDRIVPLALHNTTRDFNAIVKRAGLKPWDEAFKACRRRRVSLWRSKYPATWVSIWMGHSQAVSDEHYASVPADAYVEQPETLRRIIAKLSKLTEPELQQAETLLDSAQHRRNKASKGDAG